MKSLINSGSETEEHIFPTPVVSGKESFLESQIRTVVGSHALVRGAADGGPAPARRPGQRDQGGGPGHRDHGGGADHHDAGGGQRR